ncbi:MAG: DNA-binding protein [Chloroflexi bacterium]|nr:DNA-binding protein [Chloroflexota bacterium]
MNSKQNDRPASDLPLGLASPARRALAGAGIARLEQLTKFSEDEVKQLHGIGPNALAQLHRALRAKGLSFADRKSRRILV